MVLATTSYTSVVLDAAERQNALKIALDGVALVVSGPLNEQAGGELGINVTP